MEKISLSMPILLFKWFTALGFTPLLFLFVVPETVSTPQAAVSFHPFYVSVTEINHNSSDKNLEISCKIFTDDFESTLSKAYQSKVDLIDTTSKGKSDKLIEDYIVKHLHVKLDGKPAKLEFVGYEREEESVWSYFQVQNSEAPKKIEIINNLLYESFDTQINIMHVSVGGNRKSTKLVFPATGAKFEF